MSEILKQIDKIVMENRQKEWDEWNGISSDSSDVEEPKIVEKDYKKLFRTGAINKNINIKNKDIVNVNKDIEVVENETDKEAYLKKQGIERRCKYRPIRTNAVRNQLINKGKILLLQRMEMHLSLEEIAKTNSNLKKRFKVTRYTVRTALIQLVFFFKMNVLDKYIEEKDSQSIIELVEKEARIVINNGDLETFGIFL